MLNEAVQRRFQYLIGSQEKFGFDARLFHSCCLSFTVVMALYLLFYAIVRDSPASLLVMSVAVVGYLSCYYQSRFRRRLNLAVSGFTIEFLILLDIYWVANTDTRLSSSYFVLMLVGILIFSAPQPRYLILLVLCNELVLCVLEILIPDTLGIQAVAVDQSVRVYLSFLSCVLFMAYIVTKFKQITSQQRQTIERYYQTLIIQNQEIKAANRAKDLFFTSISHDIRTPLNAIIGFSKRLLIKIPDKLEERELAALESIHRSGQNMMVLLNDLLDFSKLDAGKMQISVDAFDLGDLLRELHTNVAIQLEAKQIQMHIEPADSSVTMTSDRQRLLQILDNLVSNAIKYGGNKDFTLRWSLQQEDTRIVFAVVDQGPGVDEEDQLYLFTAYASNRYQYNDNEHSTGLGLSIVAKLAELLGGKISYKKLSNGSEFAVELPLQLLLPLPQRNQTHTA